MIFAENYIWKVSAQPASLKSPLSPAISLPFTRRGRRGAKGERSVVSPI